MAAKLPFYISTAISYPNGAPHIGHAYEAIATDAIARFERLDGREVFFLTGTDEHGIKMLQTARAQNMTAGELADRNTPRFREMAKLLNISNDDFISTREERHKIACQEIWRRMQANGDIYLGKYDGWYSVRDEAFYDEKDLTKAEDGTRLSPEGTPVEWVEEACYFFQLSAYQDKLIAHFEAHDEFVLPPEKRNEVVNFIKGGLRDLSISRTTFDWGVPVPDAPDHVMYVWIDALTNYITALGFPDTDGALYQKFWPADVHVIGKDIVRFHAIYWPAFLMSAGLDMPRRVFAHGFMLNKGEKMSKSVGNVVDPFDLADAYGVDQLRYFLLRETTFGQDGNYDEDGIANRINADLANDLGNLAQRSLSMIAKNCNGLVPTPGAMTAADSALLAQTDAIYADARAHMNTQAIKKYLDAVWAVVAEANRYFAGEEPWAKKKTEPERMATVLYVTAEVVRNIAILATPAVPDSANQLLDLLAQPEDARTFAHLGRDHTLTPGIALPAPEGVFPRYIAPDKAGDRDNA